MNIYMYTMEQGALKDMPVSKMSTIKFHDAG